MEKGIQKKDKLRRMSRRSRRDGTKRAGHFESSAISVFYLIGKTDRSSIELLVYSKQLSTVASLHFNTFEVICKEILQVGVERCLTQFWTAGIKSPGWHRIISGISSYKKTGTEKNMVLYYSVWLQLCGSNSFIIYVA